MHVPSPVPARPQGLRRKESFRIPVPIHSCLYHTDTLNPTPGRRGCGAKQNGLSDKALQCLLKDNVALVLVLELCVNGQQAGLSGRVCVATTHIYQNQGFPNVKMWQVKALCLSQ